MSRQTVAEVANENAQKHMKQEVLKAVDKIYATYGYENYVPYDKIREAIETLDTTWL